MEWWDKMLFPIRRMWTGVATHLGIRKSGLLKLRHDVRSCEYEDVRRMWQMLNQNEMKHGRYPRKSKKGKFLKFFAWARWAHMCRNC